MKTMITPLALGLGLMLLMAPSCQKETEVREKIGYEQYVLQADNEPVTLEMANDGETVYMRLVSEGNAPTSFSVVAANNCDSLHGLWQNTTHPLSVGTTVTLRRDTVWTAFPGSPRSKCLCVIVEDHDMASINEPAVVPGDVPAGNVGNTEAGSFVSPMRYCIR